jgi:hypothetical protein
MSQGYEANHSGQFLERIVKQEFAARKFVIKNFGEDGDNLDLFAPQVLVCRVPYTSVADIDGHSEFVVTHESRKIRIECKWQNGEGSADERLFYTLENAIYAYPEREVLILYGGGGAREGIINYIKRKAAQISQKKILVLNINEFPSWVKKEFVGLRAVS